MAINRRATLTLLSALVLPPLADAQAQPVLDAASASAASETGDLYIFNDSGRTLIPSNQVVTDNGKQVASLARQTYVKLVLPAGPHLLRPDPFLWKQEVSLSVSAGSRHYVVIAYKPERSWAMPFSGPPLMLREISEQEAAPLLREMKPQ